MGARLLLVRHGETEWHAENRYAGASEVGLTERGDRQAGRLAGFLGALPGDQRPTALYCSPQGRARRTAAPAAETLGLDPVIRPGLREVDFGVAEGSTLAELRERDPRMVERFLADPVGGAFPGAESPADAAARAVAELHGIAAAEPGGRVLVVAHNTLIRLSLCAMLGIALRDYRRVFPKLDNVAITEVEITGEAVGLLRFNRPVT